MKDCRKKCQWVYNSFSTTQLLGSIFLSEALNASSAWLSKSIICHTSLHWIDEILKARKPGVHSYEIICTIGSSIWKVCEKLPKRRQLWAKGQNMAKHFFVGTFHVGHISDRTSAFDLKFYLTDICLICLTWPSCWSLILKVNLLVKRENKTLFQKKRSKARINSTLETNW